MLIKIGEFDCTECWDGVFYKKLSNYPAISEWEIQNVLDFEHYEKQNGRDCFIEADHDILKVIENYKRIYESGKRVNVPEKITECIALNFGWHRSAGSVLKKLLTLKLPLRENLYH